MNELKFTGFQESTTLDSRDVAEMLNKSHNEMLKDIRKYTEYFNEGKIPHVDFFVETTYIAKNGQKQPNYQITKKGCEFLAHKLTGQKGAIFTAKYIQAFDNMKATSASYLPQDNIIKMLVQSQNNMLTMIQTLNSKIDNIQSVEKMQKPIEKHPTTQKTKLTEEEKLQKIIQRGKLSSRFKILKFPTKIIAMVDLLLSQEHISYTYIRKILKEKGYDISYNSIVNYHKAIQGGF